MICRTIIEYYLVIILSLYSLVSLFYIVSSSISSVLFILHVREDLKDWVFFACNWILMIFHYNLVIVCMTCTTKATSVANRINYYFCIPLYELIKSRPKIYKLISFTCHLVHISYLLLVLKCYYDHRTG